jgi:hypothetical protein
MTIEEWALVAAVAFSGPWSGLLAMLTTILHPMMAAMDGRAFRTFMEAFLRFARKAWFNYVCSIGMGLAPIVALVALWGDWSSASFVLTAIGLGSVIVGVRRRQRVEGTALRRDTGLGPRGHAGGLGGGPTTLLHDQLDQRRVNLVGVRTVCRSLNAAVGNCAPGGAWLAQRLVHPIGGVAAQRRHPARVAAEVRLDSSLSGEVLDVLRVNATTERDGGAAMPLLSPP